MLSIGAFARLGQVSPRMLRRYDQLGLLQPERVDPANGYRLYAVGQLARLHQVLALRDLGFTLEQIADVLRDEPPVEQLRGMLRLRLAQIEAALDDEHARLRRVEAHLRALERNAMALQDVVIKSTQPLRLAEMVATAPGFGHANLGPVFATVVPEVIAALGRAGIRPGMMVAHYDEPTNDESVVVHIGFDIGDQPMSSNGPLTVVDLPIVEVASVVHKGSIEDVVSTYEELVRWVEDSGHSLAGRSRELYLEWNDDDVEHNITELQMPIR